MLAKEFRATLPAHVTRVSVDGAGLKSAHFNLGTTNMVYTMRKPPRRPWKKQLHGHLTVICLIKLPNSYLPAVMLAKGRGGATHLLDP
jgi:aminoglycoside phosphotransferase (APT) family kinase protein